MNAKNRLADLQDLIDRQLTGWAVGFSIAYASSHILRDVSLTDAMQQSKRLPLECSR